MFIRFFVLFFGFVSSAMFSQSFDKDTIRLKEVIVEKDFKKSKIKKVKYGRHKYVYVKSELYFTNDPVFYLTDSLPEGTIQQITLFFTQITTKFEFGGRDYKTFKVNKTEFEVTLYEVNDDYSVGRKINSEPMLIVLEESTDDKLKKVDLDFSKHNYKTKRFFICLKKLTDTSCEDCYYYAPLQYKTANGYCLYIKEDAKDIYKKKEDSCVGLQIEVKTLTSDY